MGNSGTLQSEAAAFKELCPEMRAINSYDLLYLETVPEHNPRLDFLTLFFLPDSRSDSGQLARRDGIQRTEQLVQRTNARKVIERALKSKGCLYISQNYSTNLDLLSFVLDRHSICFEAFLDLSAAGSAPTFHPIGNRSF